MKKTFKYFMMFAFIVAITGCSSKSKINEDAKVAYVNALQDMENLKSANINAKALIELEGITAKIATEFQFNNEQDLQLIGDIDVAASGIKIDNILNYYVKDNIVYLNISDTEKIKISLDTLMQSSNTQDNEPNTSNQLTDDAYSMLSSLTLEKENDTTSIHGVFHKDALKQIQDSANELLETMDTQDIEIAVSKISEFKFNITLDNNMSIQGLEYTLACTYNAKKDGEIKSIPLTCTFIVDFTNKNQVKEIIYPSFDEYEEFDENTLNSLMDEVETSTSVMI